MSFQYRWLAIGLMFVSFGTFGEWTKLHATDEYVFYMDISTQKVVDPDNRTIKMWIMMDVKQPFKIDRVDYHSTQRLVLFDCKNERVRDLSVVHTTGHLGYGDASLVDNAVTDWLYYPPNTLLDTLSKLVCR